MGLSNYPTGFNQGVLLREVLDVDAVPGKIFYVGNNATLLKGERGASNNNDGTFLSPFSTIDYAVGRCASGRGDVIVVRPGYAETVSAASGIDIDVDGVQLIGLGQGDDAPTITFATSTSATLVVDGNNCRIRGLRFRCNIASQTQMIDVMGEDCVIEHCDFAEGTATGLKFISADTVDGDSDGLTIRYNRFYMPTAGNGDSAININKDHDRIFIYGNDIHGDFDLAGIDFPSAGDACKNVTIYDNRVRNLQSGQHAIQISGTTTTGVIANNVLMGDTIGAILDPGGLFCSGNRAVTAADDPGQEIPITSSDRVQVAMKTNATMSADDLFDINTGSVLIHSLVGIVTTAESGGTNPTVSLQNDADSGTDVVIATGVDMASAAVSDSYTVSAANVLTATAGGAASDTFLPRILTAGVIESVLDSGSYSAGDLTWIIAWEPVTASATVTAAA